METDETYPLPAAEVVREAADLADADGDPAWRVTLYAAWVAQLFSIMGFSFVMPFFPFYIREELGVTDPQMVPIWAGLLATAGGISMTATAPLWGMVADRYGRKLMVQRAMFAGAAILGLMGLVHNVNQLLALRLLQGAFTGTISASVALVSSVTPRNRLGYSLGLMQTAVFTGASVGPFVGGWMADHFGYRMPFAATAVVLFVGGLLVLFGTRESFRRPAAAERSGDLTARGLLGLPGVMTLLIVYFMLNLSGTVVGPIFPLFVERLMRTSQGAASTTGLLLAVGGIVAAVSSVAAGRLSDRMGHRRILIFSTAFAGLCTFPQAVARTVGQLLGMRVLFGLGAGGMSPSVNALMASIVPRNCLGRIYGFTTAASSIGIAIGPTVGGWLASSAGLRMPFVLMGALLVLLALTVSRRVSALAPPELLPVEGCEPAEAGRA